MTFNSGEDRDSTVPARAPHPMLPKATKAIVPFSRTFKPRLLVIIDAEESFNWHAPFSRTNIRADTKAAQGQTRIIFERFGIKPTYAVDYPVASQPAGYQPLVDLSRSGFCDIGAQLHPWVTPPYEEMVSEENSYANNLPPELEKRKIQELTAKIHEIFQIRPKLYRAGRYGAGHATPQILEGLGYEIDCSVLPGMKLAPAAPDYSGGIARPYWLGETRSLLEIPVTIGTVGFAGKKGERIYQRLASPVGRKLRIPAIAARLGIVERIRLTPEGTTIDEAKRLTHKLLRDENRIFVISYHSPSLEPGNTPYVRDRNDLKVFLRWLEEYLEFFMAQLGGLPSTPSEVRDWARAAPALT
ncbi:MAG TPA: hypothetical protein VHW02_14645 [Rhizomicrobium sp.]|jgi:hypothetical protein|nr:hypothetical protein [Rhizomicrobium sp.]